MNKILTKITDQFVHFNCRFIWKIRPIKNIALFNILIRIWVILTNSAYKITGRFIKLVPIVHYNYKMVIIFVREK